MGSPSHAPRQTNAALAAGIAGLVTAAGIIVFEIVLPGLVTGQQRVSGTTDEATIRSYYDHAALGPVALGGFLIAATAIVFFAGLDHDLRSRGASPFMAKLGFYFGLANAPAYLLTAAFGATLATLAAGGVALLPIFRLWDVYYNSGAYMFEVGFLSCFSLAMRTSTGWPGWMSWLGFVTAAAQSFNALAFWLHVPDAATLPGNVLMLVFLGACGGRLVQHGRQRPAAPSTKATTLGLLAR